MRKLLILLLAISFLLNISLLTAQTANKQIPDPLRFKKEVNAFVQYDKKNSFPEQAILFLGSSSIRKWYTHDAFPEFPILNRGFGGSHLSDVLYYYDDLLKKYDPSVVVFYEGDNDIAYGKSPQQIFDDYKTFIARFNKDFPHSKLIFISIKPSILRWKKWPLMQQTNQLIRKFNEQHANLFYLDLAKVLLDKDGKPDANLYIKDGLHLNANGYARWNRTLRPLLKKLYHKDISK